MIAGAVVDSTKVAEAFGTGLAARVVRNRSACAAGNHSVRPALWIKD